MSPNEYDHKEFDKIYEEFCIAPLRKVAYGKPFKLIGREYEEELAKYSELKSAYQADFILVVNLSNQSIEFANGLSDSLGEPNNITLKRFMQLVHPDYLKNYLIWGIAAYKLAKELKIHIEPLKQTYRLSVPLKHYDGQYYWYSQLATALVIDENNLMMSHLNKYHYEGKWRQDDYSHFKVCITNNRQPADMWYERIIKYVTPYVMDEFTNREVEILQLYTQDYTSQEIADTLISPKIVKDSHKNISLETVKDFNKKILKKGREVFKQNFKTASEVAKYCSEQGFLNLLEISK